MARLAALAAVVAAHPRLLVVADEIYGNILSYMVNTIQRAQEKDRRYTERVYMEVQQTTYLCVEGPCPFFGSALCVCMRVFACLFVAMFVYSFDGRIAIKCRSSGG